MARTKKSNKKNDETPKIIRNYDPMSLEKRLYDLDHAPQRSWDLYAMEKRIHDLEINGGGGGANLTTLNANPTTSAQTITPEDPYDGFNEVNISAVTSSIDENITAGNIKKDVTILGVTGTFEGGGGGDTDIIVRYSGQSTSGSHTITKTGTYVVWTVLASNYLGDFRFTINGNSATSTIQSGVISQADLSAGVGYTYSEISLTAGDVFAWNVTNANRCFIMFSK